MLRKLQDRRRLLAGVIVTGLGSALCGAADVGDPAQLFTTVDENFNPVNMADLIDGRPLVLAVGSCS